MNYIIKINFTCLSLTFRMWSLEILSLYVQLSFVAHFLKITLISMHISYVPLGLSMVLQQEHKTCPG